MKILDVPRSGSFGGVTSSRNRYGQYVRTRAIPVQPNTPAQGTQRALMSASAATWRTLTDTQRAGWSDLAQSINRTDSLGQSHTMTGFDCFCSVNMNLAQAGDANITAAPALVTPPTILTATITATAGTPALSIAYTPTPLGAGQRLFTYASPQRSAGRKFEKDMRLIAHSAAAAASPANILAAYILRMGALVAGNRIFFAFRTYQAGFLSGPLYSSAVVGA
jgi:hypothetical protein